jgi:hypothetical protein
MTVKVAVKVKTFISKAFKLLLLTEAKVARAIFIAEGSRTTWGSLDEVTDPSFANWPCYWCIFVANAVYHIITTLT